MQKSFINTSAIVDDGRGLPKVEVIVDNGKRYGPDGRSVSTSRILLYKTNVYTSPDEKQPFGHATEGVCYRLAFGALPNGSVPQKVGLTKEGLLALRGAIDLLLQEFPLE